MVGEGQAWDAVGTTGSGGGGLRLRIGAAAYPKTAVIHSVTTT